MNPYGFNLSDPRDMLLVNVVVVVAALAVMLLWLMEDVDRLHRITSPRLVFVAPRQTADKEAPPVDYTEGAIETDFEVV
jgi:hypothetical protein